MNLRARLAEFRHDFASEVQNARSRWQSRSALILELEDQSGARGQGEAAPLPGYSRDDLAACRAALADLQFDEFETSSDQPIDDVLRRASAQIPDSLPAARHAVETALLDLLSRKREVPAWQLLAQVKGSDEPVPGLALSHLLPSALSEPSVIENSLQGAIERGIRAFKLKLGTTDFARELETARFVRGLIGDSALRFDVNQSWTRDEARTRLPLLAEFDPEFVEESVPFEILRSMGKSPVPLALDESLQLPFCDVAEARALGVEVFVLKPMALGGLSRCLALSREALKSELKSVVSHLFDGPIALASAASLAMVVQARDYAVALDRHAGLNAWVQASNTGLPCPPALTPRELVRWREPGLGLPLLDLEAA